MQLDARAPIVYCSLVALGAGVAVLGLLTGTSELSGDAVIAVLLERDGSRASTIVWSIRMPRVLLGLVVGACLGASGAAYQGMFRNPLADPYLMGAASGAALGAVLAMAAAGSLGAAHAAGLAPASDTLVTICAFAGALAAVAFAVVLAGGAARGHDLVLSGVVVGSVLAGLTTFVMMWDADRVRAAFVFLLGSLSLADWGAVSATAAVLVVALIALLALARTFDAMQLGDDVVRSLGLPLGACRLIGIGAATLATAAAVAATGIIGFVGLIVPHIARRLLGPAHLPLLIASALGGAALLGAADLIARVVVRPAELPVGVVTTLLGGPFFLVLLWRSRAAQG